MIEIVFPVLVFLYNWLFMSTFEGLLLFVMGTAPRTVRHVWCQQETKLPPQCEP